MNPPMHTRETELNWVIETVVTAGQRAQTIRMSGLTRSEKTHQDFVTSADREVEARIRELIGRRFPGDTVLGEEAGDGAPGDASRDADTADTAAAPATWILDPVDGTSNFAAGLDTWCVSLARVRNGDADLAVIYAPDRDELYTAVAGGGAWLNGRPLAVSRDVPPEHSLIMTGRGAVLPIEAYLEVLRRLITAGFEYRRYGSGALGIAMVATGAIQGYIETGMYPWDVAAARRIAAEAGAFVSAFPLAPATAQPGPALVVCQPGLEEMLFPLLPATILQTGSDRLH